MKRSDIEHPDKWTFYEAILDDLHFEWPDPFDNSQEDALKDCITYLDQVFQGKYKIRSFERKAET